MTVKLTIYDRFQTPLLINPDHVVDVLPRKQLTPVDAQQNPSTQFTYAGATVSMVTGKTHLVMENFDVVEQKLNPPPLPTMVGSGTSSQTVVLPETSVASSPVINQPDGPGDGRTTAQKKASTAAEELKRVPAAEE
jgi:hypothetical protein